jgi:membrane protein involved in colicin uptake
MKYTVTGKSVVITGGVLTLSAVQSADRAHLLQPLKEKNKYQVTGAVTFKKGEEFGYDGELPKYLADDVETEKSAKPEKAAAEKAAAEKAAAEKAAAEKAAAEKAAAEKAGEKTGDKGEGSN